MSVAGYKNSQIPSLERKQRKRRTTSLKLCNMKLDNTSRLMSVNACAGHANLLCIVPKTLTETRQSKKETTKIQRCSEPRVQQMSTAVGQTATIPRTRESSQGSRRTTYRDQKNGCSRQQLPTTCNVRCTKARHEKQRSSKTKKNKVNVKYSRVATFVRFPTKDVLKFRVKIEIC